MTKKIISGVYQLKVPIPNNPLGCTNDYLLQGKDGYTLIDTGWNSDEAFNALRQELAAIGATFKDIKQIIITHAHYDHYGLADRVRHISGAKVALHRRDEEILHTRFNVTEEYLHRSEDWFRLNGVPASESLNIRIPAGGYKVAGILMQPDIFLNGGETLSNELFDLKVIWTPGHSPGHICLYEQSQKLLFCGDHILSVITPNISLPPASDSNPLDDFIKSLHTVRNLSINSVLPAHESIFSNLSKRVDEILQHHEVRNMEILQALQTTAMTAYQISHLITWMPEFGGVKFNDLKTWDKRAAVSETLAHLKAMNVHGKVTSERQDSLIYYRRK